MNPNQDRDTPARIRMVTGHEGKVNPVLMGYAKLDTKEYTRLWFQCTRKQWYIFHYKYNELSARHCNKDQGYGGSQETETPACLICSIKDPRDYRPDIPSWNEKRDNGTLVKQRTQDRVIQKCVLDARSGKVTGKMKS